MNSPNKNKYLLAGLLSFSLALSVTLFLKKRSVDAALKESTTPSVTQATTPSSAQPKLTEKPFSDVLLTEFKIFDSEKMTVRIDQQNAEVRKKFSVADDQIATPKDFHRFELTDLNKYMALNQELVERSHTDGVDSGLDLIKTDIFLKAPFQKLISIAGPVYLIPKSEKIISLPTKNSCLGHVPTGSGRIYNLRTKKEIFKFDFPEGSREAIILENTKTNEFNFDLIQELPVQSAQTTCEAGSPVQNIKTSYQISCHNYESSCLLVANEIERTEGCSHVGVCD